MRKFSNVLIVEKEERGRVEWYRREEAQHPWLAKLIRKLVSCVLDFTKVLPKFSSTWRKARTRAQSFREVQEDTNVWQNRSSLSLSPNTWGQKTIYDIFFGVDRKYFFGIISKTFKSTRNYVIKMRPATGYMLVLQRKEVVAKWRGQVGGQERKIESKSNFIPRGIQYLKPCIVTTSVRSQIWLWNKRTRKSLFHSSSKFRTKNK